MTLSIDLILIIIALLLAIYAEFRTQGNDLVAWAVILLAVAALPIS